jgi:hypothetical protein
MFFNRQYFLIVLGFVLLSQTSFVTAEEQVKWTSSSDSDENPSLPLSKKVRQQLLQLQQAISSSPDPEGTLRQVAEANGMSPQELANMINKNARDLQQDPSLVETTTLPKMVFKIISGLAVMISQLAKRHPQSFGLTALSILLVVYAMIQTPRTGLHVASSKGLLLSNGPTTIFSPPNKYVHKLLEKKSSTSSRKNDNLSIQTLKKDWDDLLQETEEEGDGVVHVHNLPRKHELCQAMTVQYTLSPDLLLEEFPFLGETKEEIVQERDEIIAMLYQNAANVLKDRTLIEFSSSDETNSIRCISNNHEGNDKHGIFIVPGLGNFGRYGLVYWKVTGETIQADESYSLTLTTLKNVGFFDGQIHVRVRKIPDEDGMLLVQVSLGVPKGGKKIPKGLGQQLIKEVAQSLTQSTDRRTKQKLARTSQNRRYKESGKRRANERRQTRNDRERLLEEMAEDRRRRWQRSNPDAGRYRPSGIRQRSPNNC